MLLGDLLRLRGGASDPGYFDPHPSTHVPGESRTAKPLTTGNPIVKPETESEKSRDPSINKSSTSPPAASSSCGPQEGSSSSNPQGDKSSRTTANPSTSGIATASGSGTNQNTADKEDDHAQVHNDTLTELTELRFVDSDIGLGVIALRDFRPNDIIWAEESIFEANWSVNSNNMGVYDRYLSLNNQPTLNALHGAFPKLARDNVVGRQRSYDHRILVNSRMELLDRVRVNLSKLEHKVLWNQDYTRRDRVRHILSRLLGNLGPNGHSRSAARTIAWFREHSTRITSTWDGQVRRGVWLLASHMNHRCKGHHNCNLEFYNRENETAMVRVRAMRAIMAGEELTLNYSLPNLQADFTCKAPCCKPSPGLPRQPPPDPNNPIIIPDDQIA